MDFTSPACVTGLMISTCTPGHRMAQILHFWPIDGSNVGSAGLAHIESKGFRDRIRPNDAS
jgi:hypothetical protein